MTVLEIKFRILIEVKSKGILCKPLDKENQKVFEEAIKKAAEAFKMHIESNYPDERLEGKVSSPEVITHLNGIIAPVV